MNRQKITVRLEAAGDIYFTSTINFHSASHNPQASLEETLFFLRENYPNLSFEATAKN